MDQVALMHRIMTLMMGRHPPHHVNSVFVFGRAQGDYEATDGDSGILETAAELYSQKLTQYLSFPGTKGHLAVKGANVSTTYPGPDVFGQRLEVLGVPVQCLVPTTEAPPHTRGDSDAFVALSKARGWANAVVITHPHQVLRAMLGILKSFALHEHKMWIFPVPPRSVNWQKRVYGSQGALLLPRGEHIDQEWDRVLRYQAKGDLASFEELEAYLQSF